MCCLIDREENDIRSDCFVIQLQHLQIGERADLPHAAAVFYTIEMPHSCMQEEVLCVMPASACSVLEPDV